MPSMQSSVSALIAAAMGLLTPMALAVSCTTQSQMTETEFPSGLGQVIGRAGAVGE
jgi:hypothetical protein